VGVRKGNLGSEPERANGYLVYHNLPFLKVFFSGDGKETQQMP